MSNPLQIQQPKTVGKGEISPEIAKIIGLPEGGLDAIAPKVEEQTPEAKKAEVDRLAEIETALKRLEAGQEGLKASNKTLPEKPIEIDWTKITEKDAYDLSIPIQAISFEVPSYMDVSLRDKNWEARWVNVNPARQGPMRLVGFIPVKEEDLDKPLALSIHKDAEGHYKYIDVILMRVHKSRLMAAYKNNFLRSTLLTNPNKIHEINKAKFGEFVQNAPIEHNPGTNTYHNVQSEARDADQLGSGGKKKMEIYI